MLTSLQLANLDSSFDTTCYEVSMHQGPRQSFYITRKSAFGKNVLRDVPLVEREVKR